MLWAVLHSVTNILGKLQRKDFPKNRRKHYMLWFLVVCIDLCAYMWYNVNNIKYSV